MTQEKINVAEHLKDCPKGMELDCTTYENLYFDYVREHAIYPIVCYTVDNKGEKISISFNWYGKHTPVDTAKCVIFPKGKTTWEGFVPPCKFNDGDVIFTHTNALKCNLDNNWVSIFKEYRYNRCACYVCLCLSDLELYHYKWEDELLCELCEIEESRLATEEEKQKLFKAIKEHGYKWNAETKTLEKLPKFKVGDKIVQKNSACTTILITNVGDEFYYSNTESSVGVLPISEQDDWELVHDKFDITTLVPFESKVLVRDCNQYEWEGEIFTRYAKSFNNCNFVTLGGQSWKQCIPYNDDTKHLLGTIDDCDEFYKTWE